jgi:hypothetical protein
MADGRHCSEYQAPPPPDATHRVIEAIRFELEGGGANGLTRSGALIVWLNRQGQTQNRSGVGNGRPRPPKRRTIDLRVDDELLCAGRWARITGIRAHASSWLTETEAKAYPGDGYVYLLSESTSSA